MGRKKIEIFHNLAMLQNLIKRDSISYQQEFLLQYSHFQSKREIFSLNPNEESPEFGEQIMFIAAVAPCYPLLCKEFPGQIVEMLTNHYQTMKHDLRKTMVQGLILMRNRNLLSQARCKDKTLRQLLHNHIVSDIKSSNQKAKNNKLNKTLQNFMYKMLKDPSGIAAKKSLEVMIELYHKNVWNDAKTVNVVAEACLSDVPKLVAPALHFFLGTNDKKFDDDEDEEEGLPDINSLKHANGVNKKRKSRSNTLDKAFAKIKKRDRAKERAEVYNFSALHLLNDAQDFADHLFSRLRQATQKNTFNFDLRLEMMNLISRLIGVHKLIVLGFYDFILSYIKPHQKNVTQILAFVAQASHELVPPDAMEAVVRAIADNFVWSNCASEVVAAGLNSLREICVRSPLAMPEELLKSLIDDYKNHRDKGPMQAARALLALFRDFNPEMLKKKDRGRTASMRIGGNLQHVAKYGETTTLSDVLDADLLEMNSDEDEEEEEDDDEPPTLISDGEEEEEIMEDDLSGSEDDEGSQAEEEYEEELDEDEFEEENEDVESLDVTDVVEDLDTPPLKKAKLSIASQKIFTDEDFAKIRERRERIDAEEMAGMKKSRPNTAINNENPDVVDVDKIMAFTRKKDDYEARMASIKDGREGREKFGSKRGKDERSSTTNREKSKTSKPMTMLVHKRSVKGKKSRSLMEKQRVLRKHITHVKKKGH